MKDNAGKDAGLILRCSGRPGLMTCQHRKPDRLWSWSGWGRNLRLPGAVSSFSCWNPCCLIMMGALTHFGASDTL